MRSLSILSLAALTHSTFVGASAAILESNTPAQFGIAKTLTVDAPSDAAISNLPTVPSFSGPTFTYGAFTDVYPSGYTLPPPFPIETSAVSSSASPSFSTTVEFYRHDQRTKHSYLRSMCFPRATGSAKADTLETGRDPKFPCNRVQNTTYSCVFNATFRVVDQNGAILNEVNPQAQQECFCSGGRGNRVWEDIAGCSECLRLHGARPISLNGDDHDVFLPTGFVEDLSSAYCAQKTELQNWADFRDDFSITHPLSYGTATGGADLLRSRTDVSNYFTETSSSAEATPTTIDRGQTGVSAGNSSATQPHSSLRQSAKGSVAAAATSTGSANSLEASAVLGIAEPRPPPLAQAHTFVIEPCFLRGVRPLQSVTTSPNKKRRLSPPEDSDSQNPSAGTISNAQGLSSPPQLSLPDQHLHTTSPPRYIPPHLTVQGVRQARSPTPELSTAASSPSAAYAGLNLDSEGTEDASGTESVRLNGRGGSLASQEVKIRGSLSNRSSSPVTKRPAADMDGGMDGAGDERSEEGVSFSEPKMKGGQHKRVASVDMIKDEPEEVDMIKNEPDDALDQFALSDVPQARSTPVSHPGSQSAGSSSPATLRATVSPETIKGRHPPATLKSDPFPVKVEDFTSVKHEATNSRFDTPSRASPSGTSQSPETSPATFRTSSPQTLRGTLSPATFRGDSVPIKAEDFPSVKQEEATTSRFADTSQSPRLSSPATLTGDYGPVKEENSSPVKEDIPILSRSLSYSRKPLPGIDEQIEIVEQILKIPLSEGENGYLVSYKWLGRVFSRSSHNDRAKKYPKEAMEGEVGPVDNSGMNLVMDPIMKDLKDEKGQPYIPLLPGLRNREHFEVVPEKAWKLIISWYGLSQGSEVMIRYCHNTSTNQASENYEYELYPPIFTIVKLPDQAEAETKGSVADRISRPVKTLASRQETFQSFLARAKKAANINTRIKVRIWKVYGGLGDGNRSATVSSGTITPDHSRSTSPAPGTVPLADAGQSLVVDLAAFLDLEVGSQRELVDIKDETANEKYNGRSSLDLVGLCRDEVIVLEEQIQGPAGGEWASDAVQNKADGDPATHAKPSAAFSKTNLKAKSSTDSGRTSPAPSLTAFTGVKTRGRTQKMDRRRGTVGLMNLTNTCYMNAAVQCFRSVEELTPYFKKGHYKPDINMKNVLGHKGELVTAYANLLTELYGDHTKSFIAPREFKNVVGKCNAMYSGNGQQDSQEFLGWLLGELDEELNRVKNKPYTQNPDSTDDMVNDPGALRAFANRCWDIYKTRYDSVITDLFSGLYKSTVACPQCNKVSITFDPFNTISLALAIKDLWIHEVYFFPQDGKPVLVSVDIDKTATMLALKEFMAKEFKSNTKKMIVAEIHRNTFYKIFDDETPIGEQNIVQSDMIAVYELRHPVPTHGWPLPLKRKDDNSDHDLPLFDLMLVAVFHRLPRGSPVEPRGLWGVPSFITIPRKDARTYDEVLYSCLTNANNMTTITIGPEEPFEREPPSNGNVDPKKPRRPSFSTLLEDDVLHEKFHIKVFPTAEQIPVGLSYKLEDSRPYISVVDRTREQRSAAVRMADSAASDSDDELTITKTNRVPLIIRPFEAILLDWEGQRYDELFARNKDDLYDQRGTPTYTKNDIIKHKDAKFDERQKERAKQKRDGITLADCLKEFGKPEVLSESNTWQCPRCEAPRRACKKMEIWKCPDIAVIHLKRFANSQTRRNKLDFRVDFPIEGLDLTEKILSLREEDGRAIYDLFGVVNHTGSLGGGHYYAFAKNYQNGEWYDYNDSVVNLMSPEKVVTRAAYLLFYRRRSSEPLGGALLQFTRAATDSHSGSREASPSGEGMRLDDSSRNGLSSAFPVAGAVHQAGDGGQTSEEDEGLGGAAGYSSTRLPSYGPATIQYTPEDMLAPTVGALEDETAAEMDMSIHNRPLKVTVDPELTVTHRSGRQPELYLGPLGPNKPGWSFDAEDATKDANTEDEDASFPRNANFQLLPLGGGYNMRPDGMPRRDSSSSAGSMDAAPPSPMSDTDDITYEDVLNPPEGFYEKRHKSDSSDMDDDTNAEPILVPDSDNTHLVVSEDPDYWLAKKDQAADFRPSTDPLDPTGRFIDPRNPPDIFVQPRVKKTQEDYYDENGFPKTGSNMRFSSHEDIQVIPYDPSNPDWDMSNVGPHYHEDLNY